MRNMALRTLTLAALLFAACGRADGEVDPLEGVVFPTLPGDPFTLGVASGDPLPDSVILWTRLALDPMNGGGMGAADVPVAWQVASDEAFEDVVKVGVEVAEARYAHSVHADVRGLEPDARYYYRFFVGDRFSPVGRTRTAPAEGSTPARLRFAFASCQDYRDGYFNAHTHLAEEDVDLVIFLGDYIYDEPGMVGVIREPGLPPGRTLDDYRAWYALTHGEAELRAALAAHPWVVTWDDHEVSNNYAGVHPEEPEPDFIARRAAAYQAFWEHIPMRGGPPVDGALQVYRDLRWGSLAHLFVLDGRQHRTDQLCEDRLGPCDELSVVPDDMLGAAQEAWLYAELAEATARWKVLANQVILSNADIGGVLTNPDQWDGYPMSRQRLLDALATVDDAVVLTGDIHVHGAADLTIDPYDRESDKVAVELVGASITASSVANPEAAGDLEQLVLANQPNILYFNARDRGYVVVELTPERLTADFRAVSTVTERGATTITTDATFTVDAGTSALRRVE